MELRLTEVTRICDALAGEPLLAASLGSKELFHSNLIGWMCEQFPEVALRVLEPWLVTETGAVESSVRREWQHADLVLQLPSRRPVLIENKTFSLPDEDQLTRYGIDLVPKLGGTAVCLLLSLADPAWPDGYTRLGGQVWRWVSYGELGHRIIEHVEEGASFAEAVLAHEGQFMVTLDRLVMATGVGDWFEPLAPPEELRQPLRQVGLLDAVGKLRGLQARHAIREVYDSEGLAPARLESGFTRSQPLLEAFWQTLDGNLIGWQIQGRQFRLAMILPGLAGTGPEHLAQRIEYAESNLSWFDFAAAHEIAGAELPNGPGWQRFNPNFIYRYATLPTDVSISAIIELVVEYGRRGQRMCVEVDDEGAGVAALE